MNFLETPLGFEARENGFLFFFGKKDASLENLKSTYPELRFLRMKQTHSDLVHEQSSNTASRLLEGDAHFTGARKIALAISTADCIPVLISDEKSGLCAGIHAGWRGVRSRIIPKTIDALFEKGAHAAHLEICIGPHIGFKSFEIGLDTLESLLESTSLEVPDHYLQTLSSEKCLLDLKGIVLLQLQEKHLRAGQILGFDTKEDPRFHSHRRDREKSGRQLSFICRV